MGRAAASRSASRVENPGVVGAAVRGASRTARAVATERVDGSNRRFARSAGRRDGRDRRTRCKAPSPGVLRFEGVKVRVADLHGFFYRRVFLRDPVEFLVLPPLTDDEGRQRATKRFNTLPPPGIHRLRRPGSGSELLDLRDYRPGDPPKMIAWKASARRDRLITKEYESDVPVRCVLFLDTSDGVRLGPPGNTLADAHGRRRGGGGAGGGRQPRPRRPDHVRRERGEGDAPGAHEDAHDQRAAATRGGVGAAAGRDRRAARAPHPPRVPAGAGTVPGADDEAGEHDAARPAVDSAAGPKCGWICARRSSRSTGSWSWLFGDWRSGHSRTPGLDDAASLR